MSIGEELQKKTSGVRIATQALSMSRAMTTTQIHQVAMLFSADHRSVRGGRAVLNRKHPLIAPVLKLIHDARSYVAARTVDYPDPGIRLIRLDQIESMTAEINKRKGELSKCLDELDEHWEEVKEDARERLKELYIESDYPAVPSTGFGIELSFPAIAPDDRLKKLHPDLYAAEQARVAAKFQEAIEQAEALAAAKMQELLGHFLERLSPSEDGKPKKLHESTLGNIRDAVEAFKSTTIGSNEQLDQIVAEIEALSAGVDAKSIRKASPEGRSDIEKQFAAMLKRVDELVEIRPVRQIDLD